MSKSHYTIGFSNLSENIRFPVTVRESLEVAAAEHPDITLIVRDNDQNTEKALAHVHEFADLPVDLAIIYHEDERAGQSLKAVLTPHNIPIISVSIPIALTVFFGVNNKQAGLLAGQELGRWINVNWEGQVDKVLVMSNQQLLDVVKQRVDFALTGLTSLVKFDASEAFYVDSGSDRELSKQRSKPVIERWADYRHIAIIGINDQASLGVVDAARELGRESDVVAVGQNASLAAEEFAKPGSRFIASIEYFPEKFGPGLIDLALRMMNGERVRRENFIEPSIVTPENFG